MSASARASHPSQDVTTAFVLRREVLAVLLDFHAQQYARAFFVRGRPTIRIVVANASAERLDAIDELLRVGIFDFVNDETCPSSELWLTLASDLRRAP